MIKRRLCLLFALSLLLTGCSNVSMTKSESGQVAEYIAYSLLKYHESPDVFVTEPADPSQEPEASSEPSSSEQPQGSDNTENPGSTPTGSIRKEDTISNVGTVFGSKEFQISLKSKGLYKSYPKNNSGTYFSLTAKENKKLLVLELTAKNTGNKNEIFKTSGNNNGYLLNGSSSDKALVTILEHDIHFVKSTIKPGKSLKSLIFFEVNEDFNSKDLSVTITKGEQSTKVAVKQ